MTESKSITKWLGIVVIMQAFILLVLLGGSPSATPAMGQIPMPAQRDQMIEQQKATNEKLDKLLALLSGGDLQVKVAKPDETKGHE